MPSYTSREAMIQALEKQGAHVRPARKNGLFIQTPKGMTTIHFTPSDHRSVKNEIAMFRRMGLIHPEDKMNKQHRKKRPPSSDGYPSYVKGDLTKDSANRFRQLLHDKGWPIEVTVKDLSEFGGNTQTTKAMYHEGYRYHPDRKKDGRGSIVWVAPDDIQELHLELITRPEAREPKVFLSENLTCSHEAWESIGTSGRCSDCGEHLPSLNVEEQTPPEENESTVAPTEPPPSPKNTPADLDGSWVVEPKDLFPEHLYRLVEDHLAVLKAVGITYEIRMRRN